MPIGPAPKTAATVPGRTSARPTAWWATESGSTRAACSGESWGGTRCTIRRGTTVNSARPPPPVE